VNNENDLLPKPGSLSFSEKNIHRIISILKWYYFFWVCLGGLILLIASLIGYKSPRLIDALTILLSSSAILFGLYKRKSWVVVLITVKSALSIVIAFFQTPLTSQAPLGPTVGIVAQTIGLGISAFEIYFFTRKEVRKYFKATDVIH
jgi:hypothetical protein